MNQRVTKDDCEKASEYDGTRDSAVKRVLDSIDRALAEEPSGDVRLAEVPPHHLAITGVEVAALLDRKSPFCVALQGEVEAGRWTSWSATHDSARCAVVVTAALPCGCERRFPVIDLALMQSASARMAIKAAEARVETAKPCTEHEQTWTPSAETRQAFEEFERAVAEPKQPGVSLEEFQRATERLRADTTPAPQCSRCGYVAQYVSEFDYGLCGKCEGGLRNPNSGTPPSRKVDHGHGT